MEGKIAKNREFEVTRITGKTNTQISRQNEALVVTIVK